MISLHVIVKIIALVLSIKDSNIQTWLFHLYEFQEIKPCLIIIGK